MVEIGHRMALLMGAGSWACLFGVSAVIQKRLSQDLMLMRTLRRQADLIIGLFDIYLGMEVLPAVEICGYALLYWRGI